MYTFKQFLAEKYNDDKQEHRDENIHRVTYSTSIGNDLVNVHFKHDRNIHPKGRYEVSFDVNNSVNKTKNANGRKILNHVVNTVKRFRNEHDHRDLRYSSEDVNSDHAAAKDRIYSKLISKHGAKMKKEWFGSGRIIKSKK